MSNIQYSPLPWRIVRRGDPVLRETSQRIVDKTGARVLDTDALDSRHVANIELEIRAVNNYVDLLSALSRLACTQVCGSVVPIHTSESCPVCNAREILRRPELVEDLRRVQGA